MPNLHMTQSLYLFHMRKAYNNNCLLTIGIANKIRKNDTPIHSCIFLKDVGGADIKDSVDIQDRDGSIEIIILSHGVNLPVDNSSDKLTVTRRHSSMMVEKEVDSSTPYLYKAAIIWQTLKNAEIRLGQEVCY